MDAAQGQFSNRTELSKKHKTWIVEKLVLEKWTVRSIASKENKLARLLKIAKVDAA